MTASWLIPAAATAAVFLAARHASPDTRHALGMPDAANMLLYGAAAIGSIAAWLAWAVWRMLT